MFAEIGLPRDPLLLPTDDLGPVPGPDVDQRRNPGAPGHRHHIFSAAGPWPDLDWHLPDLLYLAERGPHANQWPDVAHVLPALNLILLCPVQMWTGTQTWPRLRVAEPGLPHPGLWFDRKQLILQTGQKKLVIQTDGVEPAPKENRHLWESMRCFDQVEG